VELRTNKAGFLVIFIKSRFITKKVKYLEDIDKSFLIRYSEYQFQKEFLSAMIRT